MSFYKIPTSSHIIINRDRLEEAIADALMDDKTFENYGYAADEANSIIQRVLDEDE